MTAIVMLLLSGMVFLMDVVSCMFVGHGVPALCLLKFFALASFVFIILCVKLMIDVMSEM